MHSSTSLHSSLASNIAETKHCVHIHVISSFSLCRALVTISCLRILRLQLFQEIKPFAFPIAVKEIKVICFN